MVKISAIVASVFLSNNFPRLTLVILICLMAILLLATVSSFPHTVQSMNYLLLSFYSSSLLSTIVALFSAMHPGADQTWFALFVWATLSSMMILPVVVLHIEHACCRPSQSTGCSLPDLKYDDNCVSEDETLRESLCTSDLGTAR